MFSWLKGFCCKSQPHLWVSEGWSIQPPTKERRRWGGVRVFTDFLFWSGSRQNSFWLRPIDLCVYTILLLIEHHFCLSGVNLEPLRHALLLLPTDQMSEPETRFKQCSEAIISICKPWNDKDCSGPTWSNTNVGQQQWSPWAHGMATIGFHFDSFRLISTHLLLHLSCCPLEAAAFAVCNLSNFWATAAVPLWVSCEALSYHKSMPCKLNWHSYIILHPNLNLKLNMSVSIEDPKIFLDFQLAPAQKYESLLMQMRCAENFIFCLANSYLWFHACRGLIVFLMGYSLKPRIWDLWKSSQSYRFHQISMNCGRALLLCWHDRVW